jgi:hypothetical protein
MTSRSGKKTVVCLYAEYLLSKYENFFVYNFDKKPYTRTLEKLDLILEDKIVSNLSRIPSGHLENSTVIFDCSQYLSPYAKKQAETMYSELSVRCKRLVLIQNEEHQIQKGVSFCSSFGPDETCPSLFRIVSCNNKELFSHSSKPCNKLRILKNLVGRGQQLSTFPYYTCNLETFEPDEDLATGRDFDSIQASKNVSVYYSLKEAKETNDLVDYCCKKGIHVSNVNSKSGVVVKKTDRVVVIFDKKRSTSSTGKYNMYSNIRVLVDTIRERSLWSGKKSFTIVIDTCRSEEMTFAMSLLTSRRKQSDLRKSSGARTPGFSPGVRMNQGSLCSLETVFSSLYVSRKLFQDKRKDGFYPCHSCTFFVYDGVLSVFRKKGEQDKWFDQIKYELERERSFLEW